MNIRQKYKQFIENRKKKELFQSLTSHGLSKFETWCHFWKVKSVVDTTNNTLAFLDQETFQDFLIQIAVLQADKKKYPHIDQDFYQNIRFLINRNEQPAEKRYVLENGKISLKNKALERKYQYGVSVIPPKNFWEKIKNFLSKIKTFIKFIFSRSVINNPQKIEGISFLNIHPLLGQPPKPISRIDLDKKVNEALKKIKSNLKSFFEKIFYFFMKSTIKNQIRKFLVQNNISDVKEFDANDFEKYYTFKKEPIPFDFKSTSKNTVQEEDLELVVDQDEEQQVAQEAAVDVEAAVNLLIETDMVLAVDLTKRIDISKVTTDNITYEQNDLIQSMLRSVSRGYKYNATGVSFISEEAQEALKRARESDYTTDNKKSICADTSVMGVLPMGFFVQEKVVEFKGKKEKERVLCYSEDYRQEQKLKNEPIIDIITDSKSKPRNYGNYNGGRGFSVADEVNITDKVKKEMGALDASIYPKIFNLSWGDVDQECNAKTESFGFWCGGIKCSNVLQKVFLAMKKQADEKKDFSHMNSFFKLISDFLERKDIEVSEKQAFILLALRTSLSSFEYCRANGTDYVNDKVLDFDKISLFKEPVYLKALKKVLSYSPEKIKTSKSIFKCHNEAGAQASVVELQNMVDRYHKVLAALKVNPPSGAPQYLWEFPAYIALISGTRICDLGYLSDVPSDHQSAIFLKEGGYHFIHKEMMANKKTGLIGRVSYDCAIMSPDAEDSFYQYFWFLFDFFNENGVHIGLDDSSVALDFFSESNFYDIFLKSSPNNQYNGYYNYKAHKYNEEDTLVCQKAFYLRGLAQHSALTIKEAFAFWDKSLKEGSLFHPTKNTGKFLEEMKKEVARVALLRKQEKAGFEFDDTDLTLLGQMKAKSLDKSFSPYDIDKLNTFLTSIGLYQEADKTALVIQFTKINTEIESLKEKTASELADMLKDAFKAEPKKDVETVLALLALASFRVSSNKGEPVQLRLEQMVAILLSMSNNPTLFQIDTGEGKTLILNIVALLYVLQGKKLNIVAHNDFEAKKGPAQMQALCTLTGVSIGPNKDIEYIEATKAIQAYLKENQESGVAPKDNSGPIVLVDEVDQVLRHLPALSSTHISMRKQDSEKTKEYYDFLTNLVSIVKDYIEQKKTSDIIAFVHDHIFIDDEKPNSFWVENFQSDLLLVENIEKAKTVLEGYKKNKDYVIENKGIRLVQKSVSGRRADKNAQLAKGLHAFLIAKELLEDEVLDLKGETDVIATGSIFDVMRYAEKTMGYTGTAGSEKIQKQIESALGSGKPDAAKTFVFPRAERKHADQWPQVPVDVEKSKETKRIFSKRYDFPAQFLASKEEQWRLLADRIKKIKEADGSVIVFFETIAEVLEFNTFLEANQITDNQLYHDAVDMNEAELILNVSSKKTVTIATSAAGRGIDFKLAKNISKEMKACALYAIVTHPALESVLKQALARVGRNEDLGVTEQIYAREDFVEAFKEHNYTPLPVSVVPLITPCRWHQDFSKKQEASYTGRLSDKQEAKPFWKKVVV